MNNLQANWSRIASGLFLAKLNGYTLTVAGTRGDWIAQISKFDANGRTIVKDTMPEIGSKADAMAQAEWFARSTEEK